jgi:transglutaminase-like putative cysteine protease
MIRIIRFLPPFINGILNVGFIKATGLAVAACLLGATAGCSGQKSVPEDSTSPPGATVKSAETPLRESWDLCFVQGARVGYVHTTYYQASEAGKSVVRIQGDMHLAISRNGEQTKQELRCTSVETPEGRLLRFKSEMQMGRELLIFTGRVVGKRLEMETSSPGKKVPGVIDWSPDYGGFFALEQSLFRKPMQPGQQRTLHTLAEGFNQLTTIEMLARDWEQIPLLHGTYELLRIDTATIFPDGNKLEQTLWTNRMGEILKTRSLAMAMETFRATKAEAMEKSDAVQFDIGLSTTVKLEKPLPSAHDTKRVVYRVHLEGSDPAAIFVTGWTQKIKSLDANTAEVTVYAIRPDRSGNTNAPADPPTAADREPNNWIQSDNPKIIALAKQAVDGDWSGLPERPAGDSVQTGSVPLSAWLTAVKLEQFVHNYIKLKDYSQAFASAAEVLETCEGDCTEHAVLLAALCRARGIPARVAIGLVYMPATQGFGYHMWTEIYIDNRTKSPLPLGEGKGEGIIGPKWIPIDATLAKGGIGAAHLKLAHSSLKDASAYSSFLPVVQVVGRLKIDVVEAE